jgi:hypothetical protein
MWYTRLWLLLWSSHLIDRAHKADTCCSESESTAGDASRRRQSERAKHVCVWLVGKTTNRTEMIKGSDELRVRVDLDPAGRPERHAVTGGVSTLKGFYNNNKKSCFISSDHKHQAS